MPRLHLIHVARIQVVSTCIHLNRLSPFTCILYQRKKCHGVMYPLVSGSKLLVRESCRRIHVSGVNAALGSHRHRDRVDELKDVPQVVVHGACPNQYRYHGLGQLGQRLVNWFSRTRTFFEDTNTDLKLTKMCQVGH